MSRLSHDPPTPKALPADGLTQTISLPDETADRPAIAALRWHVPPDADGLFQLLDLRVAPAHQRRGHGGELLAACYAEASALMPPRRVWAAVRQKSHVRMRAFLTKHGFHQTAMLNGLAPDEAVLIYSRAFD